MKILRSTEWEPVGFQEEFSFSDHQPVFFFRHRKYEDIVALNVAKYVDVMNNIVYFFNASAKEKVCVSRNTKVDVDHSSVQGLKAKCGV